MAKVIFVCTSNKDRSPALQEYFAANYPKHEFRSAGINKYFTTKHNTHYLTEEDVVWADLFVFAEQIHKDIADLPDENKLCVVLGLGEYRQGQIGEDYLIKADEKLGGLINTL